MRLSAVKCTYCCLSHKQRAPLATTIIKKKKCHAYVHFNTIFSQIIFYLLISQKGHRLFLSTFSIAENSVKILHWANHITKRDQSPAMHQLCLQTQQHTSATYQGQQPREGCQCGRVTGHDCQSSTVRNPGVGGRQAG